jgi:amino acid transporter
MADPVSSVAYAIEAALRALNGHLELLLPTMSIVIAIIALVTINYWQLVRAFPEGGGSPEAAGRAFGEEWTFWRSISPPRQSSPSRWWST